MAEPRETTRRQLAIAARQVNEPAARSALYRALLEQLLYLRASWTEAGDSTTFDADTRRLFTLADHAAGLDGVDRAMVEAFCRELAALAAACKPVVDDDFVSATGFMVKTGAGEYAAVAHESYVTLYAEADEVDT